MAEPIKPAAFTPKQTPATSKTAREYKSTGRIIAITALVLIAIGITWWLSSSDTSDAKPAITTPVSTDTPSAPANPPAPTTQEEQHAARKQAQKLLGDALKLSETLQAHGVTQWASDTFDRATQTIALGDKHYKQGLFQDAINHYQHAKNALQSVSDNMNTVLDSHLLRAQEAINQGKETAAKAALTVAALISSDNEQLAQLQKRLSVLPQVQQHIAQAQQAQAQRDNTRALDHYKRALSLDGDTPHLAKHIATLEQQQQHSRYQQFMSQGFQAMQAKQYGKAIAHFKEAKAIVNNSAAINALREANQKHITAQLNALQTTGQQAEGKEQWRAARDAYKKALKLDNNMTFAKHGLARVNKRLTLLNDMQKRIDKPAIINSDAKEKAAKKLVSTARQLSPKGPRWLATIKKLEAAIALASTPLPLFINSDGETTIRVSTLGNIGKAHSKTLTLRPGRYTLIGSRRGYREVRQQIVLAPNTAMPQVTLICTDAIP